MKLLLSLSMLACTMTAMAETESKDSVDINKPVFTVIKENPITSIKNQSRSGTCWDYSTLSFFESEILKKSGKTYDLSEMFVCNKNYMDRAVNTVRLHGDMQFEQGGSAYDVLYILQNYGICPEEAMALPGAMYGDTLNNFSEFFTVMPAYVKTLATSGAKKLSPAWKNGLQGIIDAYIGKVPETFTYDGRQYTPKEFAKSLGLDWNDYISITSYTHRPFWTEFPVEVQDNWRQGPSWNVPMDDMARIIDHAVDNGYTIAWGGDVSEDGFTRDGLAMLVDTRQMQDKEGSDMAKWLKLTDKEKKEKIQKLGVNVPEITPSQEQRQKEFDNWELTDDHGMLIYGKAKDQNGREYYMVKNSWGKTGEYKGTWYMTKNFIIAKTMDFLVNKNALPKDIRKKLGI
ncbi:MAG: C1 family peptidase [Prevotellaceae bacterium]|nr:C1 family peptidase [Prevotellaceae bacterium]